MSEITLIAPKTPSPGNCLLQDRSGSWVVVWKRKGQMAPCYKIDQEGMVEVPAVAASHLLEMGCSLPEGMSVPDLAKALTDAPDHHLEDWLRAHGERGHSFDRFTHIQSAKLRSDEPLTPEDRAEIADQLDSMFQTLHPKGPGRIVVMPTEKKRQRARALAGISQ